ncbi:MAG: HAD-IA family hydrolase [Lachnospiraceae bacterium]|nr:HAD-IA family hydrolase [Lachnospiraceae bacterium]
MWIWPEIDRLYLGRFDYQVPGSLKAAIEGMSFDETAMYFKDHFPRITDSVKEMQQCWHDLSFAFYSEKVTLKPGAKELLQQARQQHYRIGIATSNSGKLTNAALRHLDITDLFDAVVTADEVSTGKPAPDIYLATAAQLHVRPENCIVFEDVPKGIQAAKRAGMYAVAVRDAQSDDVWEEKVRLSDEAVSGFGEWTLPLL